MQQLFILNYKQKSQVNNYNIYFIYSTYQIIFKFEKILTLVINKTNNVVIKML